MIKRKPPLGHRVSGCGQIAPTTYTTAPRMTPGSFVVPALTTSAMYPQVGLGANLEDVA